METILFGNTVDLEKTLKKWSTIFRNNPIEHNVKCLSLYAEHTTTLTSEYVSTQGNGMGSVAIPINGNTMGLVANNPINMNPIINNTVFGVKILEKLLEIDNVDVTFEIEDMSDIQTYCIDVEYPSELLSQDYYDNIIVTGVFDYIKEQIEAKIKENCKATLVPYSLIFDYLKSHKGYIIKIYSRFLVR